MFPPQGGQVIFVGIRATNVDGCALQLTGALRDLATQEVRVDSRTVDLIPRGDGWGVSGMRDIGLGVANFANVPVCPNEWSSTNIYGTVYGLEVTAQDRGGARSPRRSTSRPSAASREPRRVPVRLQGRIRARAGLPDEGGPDGGADACGG